MTYTWSPSPYFLHDSNVARLMRRLDVSTADELRARSIGDIGAFWEAVIADLGIEFRTPFTSTVDLARGIEHPEWFVGGRINIVDATLMRWARETPEAIAVAHESEDGAVRRLTFAELEEEVSRVRRGLRARGVVKGDVVGLYMPMIPEAVVATYAVASIGAVVVPLFSGFAPAAIASRLEDARAKAVITADGTVRRGKPVEMLSQLEEALASCPTVELVVVVDNIDAPHEEPDDRVIGWRELLACEPDSLVEGTSSSDVLLLAYTSGTTGKPKGAVHTHAGFLVKVASEVAYAFDVSPGRTFCWITDMGWIMGPLSVVGAHACGGSLMLFEGSVDVPDSSRLWSLIGRHRISVLGVSPTLVRALRTADSSSPTADLSSVQVLGSTGEPWDPVSYDWLAKDVFESRVPIINFSGGTEVGGSFLCPYPVEDIRSCSLGGPALGMDVDVVDDDGVSLRGAIGELVCRQPWPSMTRGIWNDDDGERYHDAYWAAWPGMWRHGDYALVDDGDWFILGRSDDVMNVAGKRVAPAEIEMIIASDPAVTETAVVGIPNVHKSDEVWAFWVGGDDADSDGEVAVRLRTLVATQLGKPFAPTQVIRVDELPKTRSAKILRRAVRAAVMKVDAGDLSGAENPEAVEGIRARVSGLS